MFTSFFGGLVSVMLLVVATCFSPDDSCSINEFTYHGYNVYGLCKTVYKVRETLLDSLSCRYEPSTVLEGHCSPHCKDKPCFGYAPATCKQLYHTIILRSKINPFQCPLKKLKIRIGCGCTAMNALLIHSYKPNITERH